MVKRYKLLCPDLKSSKFVISRDVAFDEFSMLNSKIEFYSYSHTNENSTQEQVEVEINSSDFSKLTSFI
jgi:hypothetical protein